MSDRLNHPRKATMAGFILRRQTETSALPAVRLDRLVRIRSTRHSHFGVSLPTQNIATKPSSTMLQDIPSITNVAAASSLNKIGSQPSIIHSECTSPRRWYSAKRHARTAQTTPWIIGAPAVIRTPVGDPTRADLRRRSRRKRSKANAANRSQSANPVSESPKMSANVMPLVLFISRRPTRSH